ncbi:MAG: helix-turn-helix domain-containing protein [Myxococcota bacterium]
MVVAALVGSGPELELHLGRDGAIDGRPAAAGTAIPVRPGSRIEVAGFQLLVVAGPGDAPLPVALTLTADRLVAALADGGTIEVRLSELRSRLLRALVAAGPGVPVDDEALIEAVWPDAHVRTRLDVNQLVHRTRRHLDRAGLAGARMLLRNPAGGSTTLQLVSSGCHRRGGPDLP